MGQALLFTGEPRVGKTTVVRRVINGVGKEFFTGFLTGEDRTDDRRVGFSIRMLDGQEGAIASLSSPSRTRVESFNQKYGPASYGVDLEFLEEVSVPTIRKSLDTASGQIIVIDEIGPIQLYSEKFKELVMDILDADQTVLLGTIVLRKSPWADELKTRDDVASFLLTPQNREIMTQMMISYLQKISQRADLSRHDGARIAKNSLPA